jgi:orotate phosphoribosyltransferase
VWKAHSVKNLGKDGGTMHDLTQPDAATALTLALARAGLIQFGRFFQPDGAAWPVALPLRWLPSYPALLRDVAAALEPLLDGIEADRILTTADATPIGVALSLRTDRPLVYPYGEVRAYTAAFAIEGAYDVASDAAARMC